MIRPERLSYPIVIAVLAIAVFLAYGNALFNQFVWDDGYLIVENPFIKSFQSLPKLFAGDLMASTALRHHDSGYYRPLSMMSFMVDYKIWRMNPFGYHLVNVLIHVANAILVFLFVDIIFRRRSLAFWAGLFFALHPIHVEAVTPIYNRMGIQTSLFVLLALVFFVQSNGLKDWKKLCGVIVLFCLGLLSKEEAIVLPLLLVAYDYFYFSKLNVSSIFKQGKWKFYLSILLLCAGYFALRQANITRQISVSFLTPGPTDTALASSLGLHILTVCKIFSFYLLKVFWPFNPSAVYWIEPVRSLDGSVFAAIGVTVGFVLLVGFLRKNKPDASFFLVFFVLSLLPFINFIPIAESYMFQERFLYLPSVTVCVLLAFLSERLFQWANSDSSKQLIAGVASLVIFFSFIVFTAITNYTWRTDLSLWSQTSQKSPDIQIAHLNFGQALLKAGRIEEAQIEFEKSLNVPHPLAGNTIYLTRLDLAKVFMLKNQTKDAEKQLQQAIQLAQQINLNSFAAYDKLGLLFAQRGQADKAEKAFQEALRQNKDFIPTRYNLGVLYFEQKQYDQAQEQFEFALSKDQDFVEAVFGLGLVSLAKGDKPLAARLFERSLKLNSDLFLAKQYLNLLKEEGF